MAPSETTAPTVVVGLLADPGLSAELSADLAKQLADLLDRETDGQARWQVEVATQALTLDEHGTLPSVQIGVPDWWALVFGWPEWWRRRLPDCLVTPYYRASSSLGGVRATEDGLALMTPGAAPS